MSGAALPELNLHPQAGDTDMAQTAVAKHIEEAREADIIHLVTQNPIIVLTDEEKFDQFYARMKQETDALQADVSTKRGRDAIAAMAYKVSQTKTVIEKSRLQLTEGWRTQTSTVNAAGKKISASLDALRDEVRAPLNAWEEKDRARVAGCQAMITRLSQAAVVQLADTSEVVRTRISEISAIEIDESTYQELAEQAIALREAALASLELSIVRLEKEEADRAELQKLRDAEVARQAADAERQRLADEQAEADRQAAERERLAAVERARVEAERVSAVEEAARAERAKVEQEVREREERAAAERQAELDKIEAERAEERAQVERERQASVARIAEAERQAQVERDRIAQEHANALADERRKAADAEAARLAEVEIQKAAEARRLQADADALAAKQRAADEQTARARDMAHRTKVTAEAQAAIVALKVSETTARNIVLAIAAGSIPHVSIAF